MATHNSSRCYIMSYQFMPQAHVLGNSVRAPMWERSTHSIITPLRGWSRTLTAFYGRGNLQINDNNGTFKFWLMLSSNVQLWPCCFLCVYGSGIVWSSQIDVPLRFEKLLTREDGHDSSAEKLRWLSVLRMKNCCDQLCELLHHDKMCY